jgi:hypothetical protein
VGAGRLGRARKAKGKRQKQKAKGKRAKGQKGKGQKAKGEARRGDGGMLECANTRGRGGCTAAAGSTKCSVRTGKRGGAHLVRNGSAQ